MKIKDEDGFEIDEDFSEKSSKETKKDNFNNSKSNNNTSCYDEEDLNSHKKRLPNKFKYKIVILLGISVLLSIFIISFLSYNKSNDKNYITDNSKDASKSLGNSNIEEKKSNKKSDIKTDIKIKTDDSNESYNRYAYQLILCCETGNFFSKAASRYERDGFDPNDTYYHNYGDMVNENMGLKQLAKDGIPSDFIDDYKYVCKRYQEALNAATESFYFDKNINPPKALGINSKKLSLFVDLMSDIGRYKMIAKTACQNRGFEPYSPY